MLEFKAYRAVEYIFPLPVEFEDHFLGRVEIKEKSTVESRYIDLMNLVTCDV